ncbi:MAG TPA: sugar ABC transporter permease, partial [Lachnoclostridium sp.]|nr:sugar ABC transporter permease [Lachnoclostridium sp.]
MKKVLENKTAIAIFVLPALIVYSVIVILPVIWSLYYSFYSGSPGLKWEFCGFDNFLRLLGDS